MPFTIHEGSRVHRAYVVVPWLLVVAILVYVPFAADVGFAPGSIDKVFRVSQLNNGIAFSIAILGLTLVTGFSGQVSLGQSAFVGLGAYTTMVLVADHDWSYVAALPASALVCFAGGMVIGIPATRVRGMYLAVITLSAAYVFPSLVRKFEWLTGGVNGKAPGRTEAKLVVPSWMPFADDRHLSRPLWVYCISIVVAAALFLGARNFLRSRPGRGLIATRDNAMSADALGVNVPLYRAMTFGVSAVYGGIAGSLLVMDSPYVTPTLFTTNMAIFLFVAMVVGGSGAISGAVAGGFFYLLVPYYLAEWARDQDGMPPGLRQLFGGSMARLHAGGGAVSITFGVTLVLVLFLAPGGFVSGVRKLRAKVVRVEPKSPLD